jgi:hypothetical protein
MATIPLRRLRLVDTATCFAMGVLLTAGATPLAALTEIPAALLMYAGIALFPIAVVIAVVATKATTSVPYVSLVVIGNLVWVVASLALMLGPWIRPNALGHAFIGIQALVVAVLLVLEHLALQRVHIAPLVAAGQ